MLGRQQRRVSSLQILARWWITAAVLLTPGVGFAEALRASAQVMTPNLARVGQALAGSMSQLGGPGRLAAAGSAAVAAFSFSAPAPVSAASRTSLNIAYVNYDDSGFSESGVPSANVFATGIVGGPAPTGSATASVSYNGMAFTPLARAALSSSTLANYDTLILFEVCDIATSLSASQQQAINTYLAAGNKILLFDGDRCAPGQGGTANYSWFQFPFTTSNPGPRGASGTLQIVENSTLTQGLANDPFSGDELGDANTATTSNPNWFAAAKTTNSLGNNGFFLAYARNSGLIVYNGADYWFSFGPTKSLTDMFLNELNQVYDPDNLPSTIPVAGLPQELGAASFPFDFGPNRDTSRDPVNTFTGSYEYTHTDLAIPGRGPSPAFVRTYNSNDTRVTPLGPGWTHSYDVRLRDPGDGTLDVILITAQGRSDRYVHNADGSYTAPSGVSTRLAKNTDGSYTATQLDLSTWSFDSTGRLLSLADRYANHSTLGYNTAGQLATVSDPAGRGSLTLAYDATSGRLTSVSDWQTPTPRVVRYDYDTSGRLLHVTDRTNRTTTFGYDGTSQRLTSITDANSHVAVTMTYDAQGRVATQKDARGLATGQQTTFSYLAPDAQGTVTTTVTYPAASFDGFAPQQIDSYNAQGQIVTHVSKPSATETLPETYTYDANGFRNQVTDARGNTTSFCYDTDYSGAAVAGSRGNLTRVIAPPPATGGNPLVTLVKYDAKNNVVETIAPKGVAAGAGTTCTTNLGAAVNTLFATDLTYDTMLGTELLSVTRHFTNPDLGQQTATTKFAYGDAANPGLVTQVTPPRGNTGPNPDTTFSTTLAYFGTGTQAGLLQRVTDPLANTTTYAYDVVGRRTSLVDPLTNTWSFAYDNEDRLTQASAPAPTAGAATLSTSASFDPVGNRLSLTDANGQITRYQYDERDSLKEVDQSATASDPNADPSKIATTYQYDNLGNLVRVFRDALDATTSNQRVVDYAYDGLNRVRKETQYPQGAWPATPNGSTTSATLLTQTTYDPNGNRLSLTDPLNQLTTFGYDALNRLTAITYSNSAPGTTTTANVGYAYDANGNRSSMSDGTGPTSYGYDELDRVLSVVSPGPNTVGYRYDLDGNRTKVIYPDNTALTYTFNKASQLQSLLDWANRSSSYTYFADGLLNTSANVNGTTAQFSYDNARRLTQVWNEGSGGASTTISRHTYTLDNVGNRTQLIEVLPQLGAPGPIGGGPMLDAAATASDFGPDQQLAASLGAPPLAQVAATSTPTGTVPPTPTTTSSVATLLTPTATIVAIPATAPSITATPSAVVTGTPTGTATAMPTPQALVTISTNLASVTLRGPSLLLPSNDPATRGQASPRGWSSQRAPGMIAPDLLTPTPTVVSVGSGQAVEPGAFLPAAPDAADVSAASSADQTADGSAADEAADGSELHAAAVDDAVIVAASGPPPSGDPTVWGDDYSGQLGDSSTSNRSTPLEVLGPAGQASCRA